MPAQHKQYDRGAPRSSRRIPVGPAVPTVFLLAGQLVCDACSDDWGELWIHREVPLDRIAMNWSGDRQDLKFLCEDEDIVDDYDSDHSFWLDIVELCRWAYVDLAEDHQQMVRAANRAKAFVQQYRPPGQQTIVTRISDRLPLEYELPIVGKGTLVFATCPVRLAGFQYDLLSE